MQNQDVQNQKLQNQELTDASTMHPVDEGPPFLGSWKKVYAAVLCYLAVMIAVLYALTRDFRY